MERLGQSFRFGADVRGQVAPKAAVVVQGSGVTGYVMQAGSRVNLSGYRVSLHLELTP
jgi:hypothetical protein